MSDVLLASAGSIGVMMFVVWLLSIPLKNVSIVDIGWGFGFVIVAWTCFLTKGFASPGWSHLLLPIVVTVWGLRLTIYLAIRNIGKPEDYRYVAMREKHGASFIWSSLLRVFVLQGVIMWVVSLPIQAAAAWPVTGAEDTSPCLFLSAVGLALDSPSELLRRLLRVVGPLADLSGCERDECHLVDSAQPGHHVVLPGQGVRCRAARKGHEKTLAGVRRLHPPDKFVFPLAARAKRSKRGRCLDFPLLTPVILASFRQSARCGLSRLAA
jgi:hypothetical protein